MLQSMSYAPAVNLIEGFIVLPSGSSHFNLVSTEKAFMGRGEPPPPPDQVAQLIKRAQDLNTQEHQIQQHRAEICSLILDAAKDTEEG